MDLLKGDVRAVSCAAFSVFWTALSLAWLNLYIRIFMRPMAAILAMAPGIARTYAVSFLLLPAVLGRLRSGGPCRSRSCWSRAMLCRPCGARRGRCRRAKTGPVCIHSCYRG